MTGLNPLASEVRRPLSYFCHKDADDQLTVHTFLFKKQYGEITCVLGLSMVAIFLIYFAKTTTLETRFSDNTLEDLTSPQSYFWKHNIFLSNLKNYHTVRRSLKGGVPMELELMFVDSVGDKSLLILKEQLLIR